MTAETPTPSNTSNGSEVMLRGELKRITFRNPANGYSVLRVDAEGNASLTVVGTCIEPRVGAHLVIRGIFTDHPRFGRQLTASSIIETPPASSEGIGRYLRSGMIKGIGEKTAQRLIDELGAQALEIVRTDPDRVARIPGIGARKARLLAEAMAQQHARGETVRFLVEHNISLNLAHKIVERYGTQAFEILKKDPYLLARHIRGIGFVTADSIAMNLGLTATSPQRLKAGIYYALERASDDGHCCLPLEQLLQRARALLGLSDETDITPHLHALATEGDVIEETGMWYLPKLLRAEDFVARFIVDRLYMPPLDRGLSPADVEQSLERAGRELQVTFSEQQRKAVYKALSERLLVITGGPGCGKTTVIRALCTMFSEAQCSILLAAPTGRAAQRISQVTSRPASTIHRLLKYDPIHRSFLYGPDQPLRADVIIVDEASMIDVALARDLLAALEKNTRLILVGDKDQLPSVGPGRVFGELVEHPEVPTVALSTLFRRAEESAITSVAHMVNAGHPPHIPEPDGSTKSDAYFVSRPQVEDAARTIEQLFADQVPKKFGISMSDIVVLTPSNRGPLGTLQLNKQIQERVNPCRGPDLELEVGESVLRLGDKVCQRVNNYQIDPGGVFNGDVGSIVEVDRARRQLVVELWDGRLVRYANDDLYELSLAYALTVHRAQGSEMPCVLLALHESHFALLDRQLVYTALTRAKKLLVVVGSKRALAIATKRTLHKRRVTQLSARINRLLVQHSKQIS
ncbi:MAG: ATP-dependent RecD-like DNA helicase [Bdellovibrionota bacterium]|nr:MAG: ATP-dependent RecD-like DNA helicase [Bdellovibrionota bacterium]